MTHAKPAIEGGNPVCRPEEFYRNLIGEAEMDAAIQVIKRATEEGGGFDRYGGVEVVAYEKEFADYVGTSAATAVSSGTAAIHSALAALKLEPGTEVVCPPISDVGGIAPVLFQLCIPVFADTSSESYNVSPEGVQAALSPRTGAIIVAHIAGEPCDMASILAIAAERNLPVIEDVAQAHGAVYHGRKCGSFGAFGAFSMMGGKHHTSGGQGGMVTCDDADLTLQAKGFADRGKMFYETGMVNECAGLNYRMTELEAGIGRVQLRRLPDILAQRRCLAARFSSNLFASSLFKLGWIPEGAQSSYWFLRVRLADGVDAEGKEAITKALVAEGIPTAPTYTDMIYHQPWFRDKKVFSKSKIPWSLSPRNINRDYDGCCPNAEAAMRKHIRIMLNESIAIETMDRLCEGLLKVEKWFTGSGAGRDHLARSLMSFKQ